MILAIRATSLLLLSFIPFFLQAGTLTVTNVNDSGAGSFREALAGIGKGECLRQCTIAFNIPGPVPQSGYFTIRPSSPLPVLFGSAVTIDGDSQTRFSGDSNPLGPEIELDGTDAGYRSGIKLGRVVVMEIRGLAVNRFEGHGIFIDNSSDVKVIGCYVGVDPTGERVLPNGISGIVARDTFGVINLEGNIVSGNRENGMYLRCNSCNFNIRRNRIGVGRTVSSLPNGANGISIGAQRGFIFGNVIAHNPHFGIVVEDDSRRVSIEGNSLEYNGLMSIGLGHDGRDDNDLLDADGGPNGRQNAPVLSSATATAASLGSNFGEVSYRGSIQTKPNTEVTIHAYASPGGGPLGLAEAKVWIGKHTIRTNAQGEAEFAFQGGFPSLQDPLLLAGGFLAATATTDEGTSELSLPIKLIADTISVTSLANSGPGSLRDAITRANQASCTPNLPCWIAFDIPHEKLVNGVAVVSITSPLPPITNDYVHIDGFSQRYLQDDTNPNGPEVEIRGSESVDSAGLTIGTPARRVAETLVHSVAITGFKGDGVSVFAVEGSGLAGYDIRLVALVIGLDPATSEPRGNHADGISLRGARSGDLLYSDATVLETIIGGNGGHGLRIDARGATVQRSLIGLWSDGGARPNRLSGVFVQGSNVRLINNTIAFNRGNGVATSPAARAVYVNSNLHSNGLLGIDRNDDGLGSGPSAAVTPPPAITSAVYDPMTNRTVVQGELGEGKPSLGLPVLDRDEIGLNFWRDTSPDPSGFGEGEAAATGPSFYPLTINGRQFRADLPGDLRGQFVTATASYTICYFEFGCHGRDTSEFSNAVLVR